MTKLSNQGRVRLLTTASVAAAALASVSAHAGETIVTPGITPPPIADTAVDAHAIIDEVQENVATIGASVINSTVESEATGPTSATSTTVSANTIAASASGNNFENEIDLAATPTGIGVGVGDGAASLGVQVNLGPVTGLVDNNLITSDYTDFTLGTIGTTTNRITAGASGNTGTTLLSGAILPEFTSNATGLSVTDSDTTGDWLQAQGTFVASTLQLQTGSITNTATATNNSILLNVLNTLADSEVIASPILDDNTIAASASGNASDSTISIEGGPAFAGTAVVTNGQINLSDGESAISATNDGSRIVAVIAADGVNTDDDAELQGSLSVSDNAITSSASGNQALGAVAGQSGNQILLADGMSFEGNETASPGASSGYESAESLSVVTADLVINNTQGNVGLPITATSDDARIGAVVDDINEGAVTLDENAITSVASGNRATSAFSTGDNMASFVGSAAVANQQSNYLTAIAAETEGDVFAAIADDDDTDESTIAVTSNTVAATAYGNSIVQGLTVDAVTQALPSSGVALTGGTDGTLDDGNVSTTGSLTVTNLQSVYNGSVTAANQSNIYVTTSDDDTVDGSTINLNLNTGEAISIANSGSNALTLAGGSIGAGAGIASVQIAENFVGSATSESTVQADVGFVDDSTVAVTGNLQRAIAYGGSISNTLDVDGESVTLNGAPNGTASVVTITGDEIAVDPQPAVAAAYGVLNVQSLGGEVTATAIPASWGDSTAFALDVDDDVTDSTLTNNANTLVAAAYGADATNVAGLSVGNLNTEDEDFASVLNLTNAQEVLDGSSLTAQVAGEQLAGTYVEDNVENSTVTTSGNVAQALVYGNRVANAVTVDANNIDTEADSFPAGIQGEAVVENGVASTEASFSLNSVQVAGGSMLATLLDDVDPELADTSVSVLTQIDGSVIDSSIAANGNALTSSVTANRAANSLTVDGNGLATTAALTNLQGVTPGATIESYIGIEGVPAVLPSGGSLAIPYPDAGGTGTVEPNTTLSGGGTLTVGAGETVALSWTGLSSEEESALEAYLSQLGFTVDAGGNTATGGPGAYNLANFNGRSLSDDTLTFTGFTVPAVAPSGGSPAIPNLGGVIIAVNGETIDPSSVTVNNNIVTGSVTGNSATNLVSVTGTGVEDGSDHLFTYGISDGVGEVAAEGDVMAANAQFVGDDAELNSQVYSTFAIDTTEDVLILDSTLEVDGNQQSSRAVANTADTTVELSATNSAAGASLASLQTSEALVTANSEVMIFAPVVSTNSSISMSDNENLALAVQNNATNTLNVEATNLNPVNGSIDALAAVGPVFGSSAWGDHTLLNRQDSTGSVDAMAETQLFNDDATDIDTIGVTQGSITVSGNSTVAEASANRAINVANVTGTASLNASAAVTNFQTSSTEVSSSATTLAGVSINGTELPLEAAVDGSSITLGDNTTTALARGNAATNVLNYTAGAIYAVGTGDAANSGVIGTGGGVEATANAQAAVLNVQVNTGGVSAVAEQASYLVALNGPGTATITNSTVGVIGNAVSAAAYGNTATNAVNLVSLNTNTATAAVGNYQYNGGNVTASATTVAYGITAGLGATTGSALSVTGNAITATAVGNNAVNAITAGN